MDKAKLLSGSSLFCELDKADLAQLARHAEPLSVRAGEVIVAQGDDGDAMYCIIKGRVKVTCIDTDEQTRFTREAGLAILQDGDCFGEMAMLTGQPRSATVTALEAGELLVLPRTQLDQYMQGNPAVMRSLIQTLATRLADADGRVHDALFLSLPRRMAKLLRWLADEHGTPHPDGILIDLDLRRDEVASFLGSAHEPISRLMTRWRDEGLIVSEMRAGKIIVRDLALLPA